MWPVAVDAAAGSVTVSVTPTVSFVVKTSPATSYLRYSPSSVKFADAKTSKIGEVSVGDQLRARGEKTEDGLNVTAREVIFGTFLVKAGTVIAVNPDEPYTSDEQTVATSLEETIPALAEADCPNLGAFIDLTQLEDAKPPAGC